MSDLYLPPTRSSQSSDEVTLRELGERLLRQKKLILGVTLLVILGVAAWTYLATPRYRSTAVIRILDEQSGFGLLADLSSLEDLELPGLGGETDLRTEMGILESSRINRAVVDSVGLRVRVEDPASRRSELVRVRRVGPSEMGGIITLLRRSDDLYAVEADEFDTPVTLPDEIRRDGALRFAGFVVELDIPAGESPEEIRLAILPEYLAVQRLREDLRIQRQDGGSRLVEVSYDSPDRELAAAVVNTVVSEYLSYKRATERGELRSTAAELRTQVDSYAVQLAGAEETLGEFQRRNRVLAPEEEAAQQVERVAELQASIDELRVERSAVADALDLVEARLEGGGSSVLRQLATLPSLISNGAIQDMLQTLVELENERSELLGRRQPDNADVRVLEERIGEVEGQLHRLTSSYVENLDGHLASARRELDRIMAELEAMPGLRMEYVRLMREREVLERTYLTLVAQLKQAEVQEAIQDEQVRVVDLGEVAHPDDPVFPKPVVNLFLGLLLGLTMGLGVALARDLWDDRVHSRDEVRAAAGGLPLVGTLPSLRESGGLVRNGRLLPGVGRRSLPAGKGAVGIDRDPWSPAAEAYRGLAADLALTNGAGEPCVFTLTCADRGEGKSTVTANLAVALAQQGFRTLLVDGDVRDGTLHRRFEIERGPGLSEILSGDASLGDAVATVELTGSARTLDLLAAGGPPERPLDLMRLEILDEVMADLRTRYDRVVINAPSLERGSDAVALGTRADAVVLIALRGVTEREALERAAERLRSAGARGFLLMVNEAGDRALGS